MHQCSSTAALVIKGDKFGQFQLLEALCTQVYTCPDLAFITGMLGRYHSNPGMDH
jgi:hypothetical protein